MNRAAIVILLVLIVVACQKKAVPVISERKRQPPPEVVTTFPPPATIAPDTAIGRMVFVNRCGKCHGLPEPAQFNFEKWEGILVSMMPKAKLNEAQKIHIRAYIKENAGK